MKHTIRNYNSSKYLEKFISLNYIYNENKNKQCESLEEKINYIISELGNNFSLRELKDWLGY